MRQLLCRNGQLVWTPALGVYSVTHSITHSLCPRHVGRNNYVPLFGVEKTGGGYEGGRVEDVAIFIMSDKNGQDQE